MALQQVSLGNNPSYLYFAKLAMMQLTQESDLSQNLCHSICKNIFQKDSVLMCSQEIREENFRKKVWAQNRATYI